MVRRFTLAGLLLWVTLVALVLAIVVPVYRWRNRAMFSDTVAALAASADGTTFAALLGDGTIRVWDGSGKPKSILSTRVLPAGGMPPRLELSSNGTLAAVWSGWPQFASNQGIEIWDIGAGKLLKTVPTPEMCSFTFLPDDDLLAVQSEVVADMDDLTVEGDEEGELIGEEDVVEVLPPPTLATQIYSLTDDLPLRTITQPGYVYFSPDGKLFAVLTESDARIQIYDAKTLRAVHEFAAPNSFWCTHLAWSPDGQSLSLLQTHTDDAGEVCWQTIEHLSSLSAEPRIIELGKKTPGIPPDFYQTIVYLPGSRTVALAGRYSDMALLDTQSFRPLKTESTRGASQVAAGMRGDTFVTAGGDLTGPYVSTAGPLPTHVDLWDVTTLRPRRRLFKQSAPNVWPAACGLAVWLAVFLVHCRRRFLRAAQSG